MNTQKAGQVAQAIWDDCLDRRGIKRECEKVDDDVRDGEILPAWAALIRSALYPCELQDLPKSITMEARVAEWVRTRIGPDHMNSRERAMRLLEEAVELVQAEGINEPLVMKQIAHVFARPAGAPEQEASGVAVCLFGWCAANGLRLRDIAEQELERIEKKPLDQIRGSLTRKADADLVTLPAAWTEKLK